MFYDRLGVHDWDDCFVRDFGRTFSTCDHSLHTLELFSTGSVIQLLDTLPRHCVQCYTMVADPTRKDSVRAVNPDNSTGAELYEAANKGLFWFNLKRLEDYDSAYKKLLHQMYDMLVQRCHEQLVGLHEYSVDMLITSAGAHTHYHIDRGPSSLWHIAGTKHLWVYPEMDFDFISQADMEAIFTGQMLEYIPYDKKFDEHSEHCELKPGQAVWWPNSAPHRVENNELCISLNFSHKTRSSVKRFNIQRANHYLMRPLGVENPNVFESGLGAEVKEFSYRAINKLRKFEPRANYRVDHATDLYIDPSMPDALAKTDKRVMPAFLSP